MFLPLGGLAFPAEDEAGCGREAEPSRNERTAVMAVAKSLPVATPVAIPVREVLPWIIFAGSLLLIGIYFVGVEEGAAAVFKGMYVHEFVHDGRHLLGFPCH
jgi:hypothetical protein